MKPIQCNCNSTEARRFKTYQKEVIINTKTRVWSEGMIELINDDEKEWSCVKCGNDIILEEV